MAHPLLFLLPGTTTRLPVRWAINRLTVKNPNDPTLTNKTQSPKETPMKTTTGKTTLTIGVIALILMISGTAMAWGPGGCGKGRGPWFGEGPGARWSDLSEEQKKQLADVHQKFIDDTAEARVAIISKYEAARVILETSEPDRTKLIALSTEINDLRRTIGEKRIDLALAARKVAPDFRFPFEFIGEGRFNGMGMGAPMMDGGCPKMKGGRGSGRTCCQDQDASFPVTPGCDRAGYGPRGCQGAPDGCPGYPQNN
jgi:zinc resistance-associated protein